MNGQIFDIQRFSIGNGPGIRTAIFMKGCPLNCLWCHNPESQRMETELLYDSTRCMNCGLCEKVCRRKVHKVTEGKHEVDHVNCIKCGACIEVCPQEAVRLAGREYSVSELSSLVMKDREYYERSGGGATFSGGEPMLQPGFLQEAMKKLKKEGIHLALDTCGFCSSESFGTILRQTDMLLFDIKCMDSGKHKRLTGADNRIILENFRLAAKQGKEILVRCPLIPDLNDSREDMKRLGEFLRGQHIKSVDVSIYHDYGAAKYVQTGRRAPKLRKYEKGEAEKILQELRDEGIQTKII